MNIDFPRARIACDLESATCCSENGWPPDNHDVPQAQGGPPACDAVSLIVPSGILARSSSAPRRPNLAILAPRETPWPWNSAGCSLAHNYEFAERLSNFTEPFRNLHRFKE